MKDIVREYQAQFRRHHKNARRYTALLLALSMVTTLFVNWQLHGSGIAATAPYLCNQVEHQHTEECYEKVLVCGYTEGEVEDWNATMPDDDMLIDDSFGIDMEEDDSGIATYSEEPEYIFVPHEHTDDCYQEVQTLTCYEQEHVHTDDCFDPEDGSLICDEFEHTHDDSCYTTEYELVCGLEEGELVEELNPDYNPIALFEEPVAAKPVVIAAVTEPPVHHHTEDCYEEVLICPLEEHHHTVNCLSDPQADVEDEAEWLAKTDTTLDGLWTDDLLAVAKTQLGYEQSEKNFQLDTDDGETVRHYTRYGQWYGNPYGAWDVMFLSYCLNYAGIPQSAVPQESSTMALHSKLRSLAYAGDFSGDMPIDAVMPGDVVIYQTTTTETVAVDDEQPTIQDDSADADIALLSLEPAAAEPQTEERTVAADTVGIVSEVDYDAGTLTVISGNVDGKVAEVTLDASQVTTLVSVAGAQAAAEDGAAEQPDSDSDTVTVDYIDYFDETKNTNNGGITSITVKKGTQVLDPSQTITLTDGTQLSLAYTFDLAENALSNLNSKELTYHLPKGITLSESKEFPLINAADSSEVGTVVVDTDGTVHIKFADGFNTDQPFSGKFDFNVVASVSSDQDSNEIKFPSGLDVVIKKATDLSITKKGSDPFVDDDGNIYIDYTIIVSSKVGWSDPIEILDKLYNTTEVSGEYVKDKFTLVKKDNDGNETPVTGYQNTFTADSFHIENLEKLNAGESYELTYRVKITKITTADGSANFQNAARSNNENDWKWWATKLENRISKSGSYDPDTNEITWTVIVKNPYGQNLKNAKVSDTIKTDGSTIIGDITLTETIDKDGNSVSNEISNTIKANETQTGFDYTFTADAFGKEYKFTYKTTVPKDNDGKPTKVINSSTVTVDNKDYSADKDVKPKDRDWNFNKSAVNGSLAATDQANQYTAEWKISSNVKNFWDSYTFVDQTKVPSYGRHYGIASELDAAIKAALTFTCVDGTTLKADAACIDISIKYYSNAFDKADEADPLYEIPANDTYQEVRTFVITLTNKHTYKGDSPIKSMDIDSYYTHVDTTGVPEGTQVDFYNNGAKYSYKRDAAKKSFIKGVAKNDGGNTDYRNEEHYKSDVPDASYTSSSNLHYQIVLDVSDWTEFPDDGTIKVTDVLQDGLTFKNKSAKAYFGWNGFAGDETNIYPDTGQVRINLNAKDSKYFSVECTDGKNITFTLSNLNDFKNELKKNGGSLTDLIIRYTADITDDEFWNRPQSESKTYVNNAQWDDKNASASITLTKDFKYLAKKADIEEVVNDKGVKTGQHIVHYSLDINPTYHDLLPGEDYVQLKDTLTVGDSNVTVHLDMDSVKLYDYPYHDGDLPLATTSYNLTYTNTKENGKDVHTLLFTLLDSHGYVLKYDYVLDSNDTVTLSNNAWLSGDHKASSTNTTTQVDGSASVSSSQITLYKVDALNPLTRLEGAKFKLSYYDGSDFTPFTDQEIHTSDSNGEVVIYLGKNEKDTSPGEYFNIEADKLYKFVEDKAPAGYQKDGDTAYYFIFGKTGETADMAWNNTLHPSDLKRENVVICTSGQQKGMYAQNTRTWLTIQKFWQDEYGNTVASGQAPETEVTVKLYRYPVGGSKENRDTTFEETITLSKDNDWTYVYKDVKEGYYYYIEELSTGKKYDVTYSDSNTTGVENGGLLTLTNKAKPGGSYELPSTGGAGTTPYTAVGGAIALAALVCGVCQKRRRERRAH